MTSTQSSAVREQSLEGLLRAGRIMTGDYRAAREFAFVAHRRNYPGYRTRFESAVDVLDRVGARPMVEAVVLDGHPPRSERGLARLVDGLHELSLHFRDAGLPIVFCDDGSGRPQIKLKRVRG